MTRPHEIEGDRRTDRPTLARRLSIRLFAITALAVMGAEIFIFVPSIANFRREWLETKLETVSVATLVSEFGENGVPLTPEQETELLRALDARLIAIRKPDSTRLLARVADLGTVDEQIDLPAEGMFEAVAAAFETLVWGGDRLLRLVGPIGDGSFAGEIVIDERPLRAAMLVYSRTILLLSLAIASFAGALVFGAISLFLLRPIRRMTGAMVRFAADPEDPARVIVPSRRQDELGLAERELADMQAILARTLREQRHLADLGLAVSKINHDLRNILASAQLVSDRLSDLPDAQVQRFAPVLIRSLDRALVYTQSVLAYGQAAESRPVRRRILLARLVDEIFEMQLVAPERRIELVNAVPPALEIDVDPEQFFRALSNLVRNAIQAVEGDDEAEALVRRVRVEAQAQADGGVRIAVDDTGPGLSDGARANLFKAFRGSTRAGGTGLGLAIAAEIVQAHGSRIRLCDTTRTGARFEIDLPGNSGAPAISPP
ncbi:sensor histidine kinase [Aureimonas pseudogalii]|uniref:histidine kinase n=1 Tax=Aureimonas pseudogalii TaxID=1744844 RepID=A0A7W6E948_9HYPH|nr:HAMP domain-containing sensor histidine kinase [Aureimonas pseudogalii]MBB3997042.1 signal transduction histidine kinase [Aureimonas pseudogalii]